MDIVFEILLEIYMELMLLVVPGKNITKKHRRIATIIAIVELVVMFALVIWGVALIADENNLLGIIPIAVVGVVSIAQIVFGIVLYGRHH